MSTQSSSVFVRLSALAISQWRLSLFLGIFMIILGFFIYQVWLHPTADIPGPFLNKLSNYPIMRHAERGTIHTYLFELHTKYGEIVRYAPNMVSYQKSEAFQDIYGFKKNATKPEDYYGTLREVSVNKHAFNTFNATSVEQHARKRRIISHAFSDAAIRAYEPLVVKTVNVFLRKLESQEKNLKQKPFDMAVEFNCLTLDIIGELCMGQSFGFIGGRGEEVIRESRPRAVNVYVNAHMPILKRIGLSKWIFPYYNKGTAFFMKWGGTVLRERVEKFQSSKGASSGQHRDILQYLLEAEDTETTSKYTPDELLAEAIGLLLGGSDTTSFNMAATMFYLASNPEKLEKLREEITTTFPSYHDITGGRVVANCRYLRACFDEALRLSPSVSLCLPRRVGKGGLKAAGRFFPEGVVVGVPHWAIFRDEKYFDDPHAFKPERWLGDKEDPKQLKMREAFQPFSVGSRNCVGKPLALNEVPYIISKLVYAFDFNMTSNYGQLDYAVTGCNEPLFYQEELLVPVGRGPEMRFRKRIDDEL